MVGATFYSADISGTIGATVNGDARSEESATREKGKA